MGNGTEIQLLSTNNITSVFFHQLIVRLIFFILTRGAAIRIFSFLPSALKNINSSVVTHRLTS